jgi:hypothetical protein
MSDTSENVLPRRSTKAVIALIVAILSLLASPFLIFLAYIALIVFATAAAEQSNSLLVLISLLLAFLLLIALAFVGPGAALVFASKARRDMRSSPGAVTGAWMVSGSRVIAGAALVVLISGLVYFVLNSMGVCSLSGCN